MHGGVDDIKLEKEIGGLTVINNIVEHNRNSCLRGRVGKQHSKDMIGTEVRQQLEENVAKYDPFNQSRSVKYEFQDKPCKGPFKGLTLDALERFIETKKREYMLKY